MNTISVNGKIVQINGSGSVVVSNGRVLVDGEEVSLKDVSKVTIEGNVGSLEVTGDVEVNGNIEGSVNAKGSVHCGEVCLGIRAGGSVKCGNVSGDIYRGDVF